MVDQDLILTTLVEIAQDAVGSSLSQVGEVGSEEPAVIKERQGGPKPDYPYVTIDLISAAHTSGWLIESGVTDLNVPFTDTHYKYLFKYYVYGGNAINIAHNLESNFRLESTLIRLHNDSGGKLEETFSVTSDPQPLATRIIEAASFTFTYNIVDRIEDTLIGVADTVSVTGELFRHEDDTEPLQVTILETSNALP